MEANLKEKPNDFKNKWTLFTKVPLSLKFRGDEIIWSKPYPEQKKSSFNQINEMAQKRKYFKMTLKNVATMVVGIDLRKIRRDERKQKHI